MYKIMAFLAVALAGVFVTPIAASATRCAPGLATAALILAIAIIALGAAQLTVRRINLRERTSP